MSGGPRKRATYEDLVAVPEHKLAQIIDGRLVVQPIFSAAEALIRMNLLGELRQPFQRARGGPGGWFFMLRPELRFGNDVLVPDLAGWRRTRMPHVTDETSTLAPDWIGEVMTSGTRRLERVGKLPIYARGGIPYAWLIDSEARTLEVLKLEGERWLILDGYAAEAEGPMLIRAKPFDAIELDLSALWADLAPGEG